MKTLFWNIGKSLSDRKLTLLSEAITSEKPDIFCVAEGSHSKADCKKIINLFDHHQYFCYYSPLFYLNDTLKLNFKYNRNGLKIFTRTDKIPSDPFSFSMQRQDGRIVALKTFINYTPTIYVFLHNLSKSGNYEVTLDQVEFIGSLVDMLEIGNSKNDIEADLPDRNLILGDFNLEPWDKVLRHKKYLSTSFFKVHNSMVKRSSASLKTYFNPLAELIFEAKTENLGGTYYSDNRGWALFDYVLFDTEESNITYNVITKFQDGSTLLNHDNQINKAFLQDDLDHLPIIIKISDL